MSAVNQYGCAAVALEQFMVNQFVQIIRILSPIGGSQGRGIVDLALQVGVLVNVEGSSF